VKIKIKRLENCHKLPEYQTEGAAAMDLYAAEDTPLWMNLPTLIPTGIQIEIPIGYEAQIRPRSGLSKSGIIIPNSPGTIDSDYRGEVKVILLISVMGLSDLPTIRASAIYDYENWELCNLLDRHGYERAGGYLIKKGTRIAQMVIAPIIKAEWEEVDELSDTQRGSGGFGSTGT